MLFQLRRAMLPCLMALTLGLTFSKSQAAEPVPSDRLLPPGVLMYVSVPSVQQFQERYSRTGYGELIHDPAMAEVKAEVMKAIDKASKEIENEIGITLEDLYNIPSGEVAFAMTPLKGKEFGGVAFFNFGEHQKQFEVLVDKLDEALKENGWTRNAESFDGTEIVTWKNAGEGLGSLSYFLKDTTFVASNQVALLEGALDRWDGKHNRVFAEDEVYSHVMKRCATRKDGDSAAYWFINPINLFQSGMQLAAQQNNGAGMQIGMVTAFLPILGIDKLRGAGGTIDMSTDEFDIESRTMVYLDQPVTGVYNFFNCPPAAPAPPAMLSADLASLSSMNWDAAKAYKAVEETVDKFQGPGMFARLMDQAEESPNGPGLHPKKDFIDLLGGGVYMIQNPPKLDNPEQPQLTILLGLKNEQRMTEVMAKIADMDGLPIITRDFRGIKIYESEETGSEVQPAMAVAKGHLIISFDVEMLETLLRNDPGADSLMKSEQFQQVAKSFPKEVSTYAFQRTDIMAEGAYEMIRKAAMEQGGNADFDFSKLPPFDSIRKYFGLSGGYSVPDEHGVYMVSFGLKPAI
ncbi:MAG: hypothetical protein R3C01_03580 [Planctomycetaceae bacterium]